MFPHLTVELVCEYMTKEMCKLCALITTLPDVWVGFDKQDFSTTARVTYAGWYFANKELRNMRGWGDCRYDHHPCRRLPHVMTCNALGNVVRKLQNRCRPDPPPPYSQWNDCQNWHNTPYTDSNEYYGGVEGHTVVSGTSVIHFDNRSSLYRLIDVRLTSLPCTLCSDPAMIIFLCCHSVSVDLQFRSVLKANRSRHDSLKICQVI